jgi:uncharacterized membrane protein YoaK (UPF0700 family)
MTFSDRRPRALALLLAALAGYVDAIGFVQLGGFFVSFMSGNSTRFAIGIIEQARHWQIAAALIGCFLLGVMTGSAIGRWRDRRRRHRAVLGLVLAVLALAALLQSAALPFPSSLALAIAMGAENATFERDGEVRVGLTYMTGALVRLGQKLVSLAWGEQAADWRAPLMLWSALLVGAVAGAAVHRLVPLGSLWAAVAVCAFACVAARMLDRLTSATPE